MSPGSAFSTSGRVPLAFHADPHFGLFRLALSKPVTETTGKRVQKVPCGIQDPDKVRQDKCLPRMGGEDVFSDVVIRSLADGLMRKIQKK